MAKKKILITITDAGNGHRSGAEAITAAINELYPGRFNIKTIDIFKAADVAPYNTSDSTYALVSQNYTLEAIHNFLFNLFCLVPVAWVVEKYTNWRLYEECSKIIAKENPDVVVSVHQMVSIIIKEIKRRQKWFKSVTVVTDLVTLMPGSADTEADIIFAPTVDAVHNLVKYGAHLNHIRYPYFPIVPKMRNVAPKAELIQELKLDKDKKTVFVTGGGNGIKSMFSGIDQLVKLENVQVVINAGRSETLKQQIEDRYGTEKNVRILGYLENMQDYFHLADVIVAKPGSATVLEIELFNKKAILTRMVGMQEKGNIEYALQNPNFRYIGDDWDKLAPTVTELLNAPAQQTSRRRVDEVFEIARGIVGLID